MVQPVLNLFAKMDLIQKVKKYIQSHNLLSNADTAIVGVSGGPDSVVLIHILHQLQYELGIELCVAHYNHGLRRGSLSDQRFVENLSRHLNVPFVCESSTKTKSRPKGSLEEWARKQRFDFFRRVAKKRKANIVALAHTENDLAETILMRILRGTGMQGLRGILPSREINGVTFIRPLLTTSRKEIESFLKRKKIAFRTDPTNTETKFFRNRIRHKLLPLLEKEYNANIREVLANLSTHITTDYDYLKQQVKISSRKTLASSPGRKNVSMDLKLLSKQHAALKRLLIREAIKHIKGDTNRLTFRHMGEIEDLLSRRPAGSIVNLPGNIHAQKSKNHLILSTTNS